MRNFKTFIYSLATLLAVTFSGCKKEEIPEMPKEPMPPVIENAKLTGLQGETVVIAGNKVKFEADIKVENSELDLFRLEIVGNNESLVFLEEKLEGTSVHLEKELDLGLSLAQVTAAFRPEVTLKVVNKDKLYTLKALDPQSVCEITIPELMEALWLVDNNGKSFQMSPVEGQRGNYRTTADLKEIGTSFKIAEKVKEDGSVDPTGKTWEFETPKTEGDYGLRWIAFDVFEEKLSKMVDYTITMDLNTMADDGSFKVYWNSELVRDCRVVLLNYPAGILMQADRFADPEGNTIRYTGETGPNFEIYFIPDVKWFIVKKQYTDLDELWLTGADASLPMAPFTDSNYPLKWFGNHQCHDAVNPVWDDDENRHVLLYLKSAFALKIYTERRWATELTWESASPDILTVTEMTVDANGQLDGNYAVAGPMFPGDGLYMIYYNINTHKVSMEKYNGPILGGVDTGTSDPDPAPDPDPIVPDPGETVPGALNLVGADNKIYPMELVEGGHYVTSKAAADVASPFKFAEKIKDGAIDYTGGVWGMKDGAIAKIDAAGEGIPLDPCFAVYSMKPEKIGFDCTANKVIYRQEIWKPVAACDDNGGKCAVVWVQTLPEGCEVVFKGFDALKIADFADPALFGEINEEAKTARYLGVSDNYEMHFFTDKNWLFLLHEISAHPALIIGHDAAVGQASDISIPIMQDDIYKVPGKNVMAYLRPDGKYYASIYLTPNFGGSFYIGGYSWGSMVTGYTSADANMTVNDGQWLGAGAGIAAGKYIMCYDPATKKISTTPMK